MRRRARQGQSKPGPIDPLLPKPDQAGSVPGDVGTWGSAAREHTIFRIGRLSRKNEHVNLRVVCPHHCSNQQLPSPHSEPQGTRRCAASSTAVRACKSNATQTRSSEGMKRFVSRGRIGHRRPVQLPVWVELRDLNHVSIPGWWAHDAQPHNARLTWSSTDFGRPRAYKLRNLGLGHCRPGDAQPLGDLGVGGAIGAGQHDAAPQRQRLRRRVSAPPTLQRLALIGAQADLDGWSSATCHGDPPMLVDNIRTTRHHHQNSRPPRNLRLNSLTGH